MAVLYRVNCGFTWLLFVTAIVGYLLTLIRLHEHWPSWIALGVGWGMLAITNTFLALGLRIEILANGVVLSSFVMVMASEALLVIKFVSMRDGKRDRSNEPRSSEGTR